jgi:Flp pilus assembly protein TadD/predicted aspartyl protease
MNSRFRGAAVSVLLAAATLVVRADTTPPSSYAADIELQVGDLYYSEGRFLESFAAYRHAVNGLNQKTLRRARVGLIRSALWVAEFDVARQEAETLVRAEPRDAEALSLYGDSLWATGEFAAAENEYRALLAIQPDSARGHHGLARALAARGRLDAAMSEAQTAVQLSPDDPEIHHTIGSIYERMRRFREAASAYFDYMNLLPNSDTSEQALWSRAEIKFLRAFDGRAPIAMAPGAETKQYVIPFTLLNGKVVIRAKVNDKSAQDFIVDTGSESTIITGATATSAGVAPITYTLSAGVGEVGLRGLQLARLNSLEIGSLKLKNVPCMIKNPPLRDLPMDERDSLSPLSLGLSMIVDYQQRQLTIGTHLPEEPADFELPLWLHRLATVEGMVDQGHAANFVVDTGGEVISISQATANSLHKPQTGRRIALRVYGTSGWDRDAFLMPGVDLAFDEIQVKNTSVVVLNMTAPSALLGYKVGGIVGHKFLSRYRVIFDLQRSVLRLRHLV